MNQKYVAKSDGHILLNVQSAAHHITQPGQQAGRHGRLSTLVTNDCTIGQLESSWHDHGNVQVNGQTAGSVQTIYLPKIKLPQASTPFIWSGSPMFRLVETIFMLSIHCIV